MHTQSKVLAVSALGIALAIVGCGSDNKQSSSAPPPPPAQAASSGAQTLALAADANGGLKFNKTKLTAKAGEVKLVMANPSSSGLAHGIAVEGNGIDKDGPTVQPGTTSTVTATLKAGTYEFYCTVSSHKKAGMEGTLTVR